MFLPEIEKDKCTNCRACVHICPKMVLNAENDAVSVDMPSLCTGCEACVAACPEQAVTVKET